MIRLVKAINSLETLSLTCSVEGIPMDAIRKHGPGLRTLCLRDYEGKVHRPLRQSRIPTLSLHALLEIRSCCPNVMELALDLDQGMMVWKALCDDSYPKPSHLKETDDRFLQSSSFTSLLLENRNLRRLAMFVQQPFFSGVDLNNEKDICPHTGKGHPHACLSRSCQANESIEVVAASSFLDRTYKAICTFIQDLLLRKQGAAFEKLSLDVAGYSDGIHPDVLSVQGQRQQIGGKSHRRTFEYEARFVNGRPTTSFERWLVQETTEKSVGRNWSER